MPLTFHVPPHSATGLEYGHVYRLDFDPPDPVAELTATFVGTVARARRGDTCVDALIFGSAVLTDWDQVFFTEIW